ncbi:MAG TPA: ABC transporter ATP-binding protein [Candidatus Eisenbacteria bacterium]
MSLSAQNIHKRFGPRPVLRGASLSLRPGEVALLLGANGSGKTTLARILATTLAADRGTVALDGEPVARRLPAARRAIGFASHRPLLYLGLTPLENLSFFGRLSGVPDARARALRALDRFGMTPFAGMPVERFSRGMLQRIALIRALLPEPRVLVLDEPYAGLDEDGTRTLNEVLLEAKGRGAAALVISHDPGRAAPLTPRVHRMREGRVEEG